MSTDSFYRNPVINKKSADSFFSILYDVPHFLQIIKRKYTMGILEGKEVFHKEKKLVSVQLSFIKNIPMCSVSFIHQKQPITISLMDCPSYFKVFHLPLWVRNDIRFFSKLFPLTMKNQAQDPEKNKQ